MLLVTKTHSEQEQIGIVQLQFVTFFNDAFKDIYYLVDLRYQAGITIHSYIHNWLSIQKLLKTCFNSNYMTPIVYLITMPLNLR